MALLRAYSRVMTKYPKMTQCGTCGVLVATGDVIAQKVIERREELLWKRTAKFAAFGMFFIGPCMTFWYRYLDRPFGAQKILLKPWQKVVIDQAIFNPGINLAAIPVLGLMNSHSPGKILGTIQDKYIDIMKASYKIWPGVQMLNFYFVPLNYRSVFVSGFSLIWNTYYTWKMGEKS